MSPSGFLSAASIAQRFIAVAVLCLAAVAMALLGQHGFDMQPCPWCILQRLLYLVIALVCLVGAVLRPRPARLAAAGLSILLAVLGMTAAVWQHVVAAKSSSCNLTLADKVLNALGVESLMPALFQVTANCADAAVKVLGIPFEYWSLALFALLALIAATTLKQRSTPA